MTEEKEKKVRKMNYECPYDVVRSSERSEIIIKFLNNADDLIDEDPLTHEDYQYFEYDAMFIGSKPDFNRKIKYKTSSKRLTNALMEHQPVKGKTFKIIKMGEKTQTFYTVAEIK